MFIISFKYEENNDFYNNLKYNVYIYNDVFYF